MTPIRVLELRSVWGTGGGPEKTILLGAARTDPRQFAITVSYIRDDRDPVFGIGSKAAGLGIDYVELRERHSFDLRVWPALRAIVRERAIDIVHAHDYKTNLLAWLLWKREGVLPLSTVHGWTGHTRRERLLYYPADRRLLCRFPIAIAVSEDIRRTLLRSGARPAAVRTILNGIDHRAFARDSGRVPEVRRMLGVEPGDLVIGAVGRLEPQKRFDLLIDVFARLRAKHEHLVLFIAGGGSQREALQARIGRLGLAARCRLLGNRSDVAALHHAFDLFVQSSDYEGTPNAVLEAMALETPVVATDAGGTAQLVRHGIDGLIVPPGDPDALLAAIDETITDPERRRRRAQSARARIETELSFDRRMAAVEQVYRELMRRAPQLGAPAVAVRT